jgi:GT2 family glycosyltransferase
MANLQRNIGCVSGAFMIARKELITAMGGFDEDFFLNGEEQDLAWRVREKGFSIGYIDNAEVFHWEGKAQLTRLMQLLLRKKLKPNIYSIQNITNQKLSHGLKKPKD